MFLHVGTASVDVEPAGGHTYDPTEGCTTDPYPSVPVVCASASELVRVNAAPSAIIVIFMAVSFAYVLRKETTRRPLGLFVQLFFSATAWLRAPRSDSARLRELDGCDGPFPMMATNRYSKAMHFVEPNFLHGAGFSVGKDHGFADELSLGMLQLGKDCGRSNLRSLLRCLAGERRVVYLRKCGSRGRRRHKRVS